MAYNPLAAIFSRIFIWIEVGMAFNAQVNPYFIPYHPVGYPGYSMCNLGGTSHVLSGALTPKLLVVDWQVASSWMNQVDR